MRILLLRIFWNLKGSLDWGRGLGVIKHLKKGFFGLIWIGWLRLLLLERED